ncbi:MAG: hypothetical protein FWH14_00680 [Oscillospiraceae bacterium]|nr:hypothetical protein [Oscillospiraceae bacterium]
MVCRDDRPRSSVVIAAAGVFSRRVRTPVRTVLCVNPQIAVGAAICHPWHNRERHEKIFLTGVDKAG